MAKVCRQINRAKVNNDNNVCDLILSTNCVVSEKAVPILGVLSGEDITKLLDRLNEYLKNIKNEVGALERSVRNNKGDSLLVPQTPYDWKKDSSLINFLKSSLGEKVDKEEGKGLSSEDYTSEDKRVVSEVKDKFKSLNAFIESTQNSLNKTLTKVTFLENVIKSLKEAVKNAVLKTDSPITFRDKLGRTTNVKLGETFNVFGKSPNLNVEVEDKTVNVFLSDNLSLDSVKTGEVTLSSEGLNLSDKKIIGLSDGVIDENSKEAVSGKQINVIATEIARQLLNLETSVNEGLSKREKLENKVHSLNEGNDEHKYPSIKLIKQMKVEIDSAISALMMESKEDKSNKTSELNSSNPEEKYPTIALLKNVKKDLEVILDRHYTAIQNLQDQITANDNSVHSAEINPTTSALTLKDKHGVTVSVLNLGFLNNEGTKFEINPTDKTLEMKNDRDEVLSSVPLRTFLSNLINGLGLEGKKIKLLDSTGNEVSSVDLNPLFDLYTTLTKTQEVEGNLTSLGVKVETNNTNIAGLTRSVTNLEQEREKIENKVDDALSVNVSEESVKYPSVKAVKKIVKELNDTLTAPLENVLTFEIQAPQIIGSIVRVELTHKVDTSKAWFVWVNGILIPRAAVTFINEIMSVDNTKVGYNIEVGDELVIHYKVKKD